MTKLRWALAGALIFMALTSALATAGVSNFRYDLKLRVNDTPVEFHIPWHCKTALEGPNFGPGGLIRTVMKTTVTTRWIARKIPNGVVFILSPTNFCVLDPPPAASDSDVQEPGIYLIDNVTHPTTLQIFNRRQSTGLGYTVRVVEDSMTQPTQAEPDYIPSAEERDLLKSVLDNCTGYERVVAQVWPKSHWESFKDLQDQFNGLTEVTSGRFQHLNELEPKKALVTSLIRQGDVWRLLPQESTDPAPEIYFPVAGPRQNTDELRAKGLMQETLPPANIDIHGTRILLGGWPSATFVYDPESRSVMRLSNSKFECWTLR